MAKTKTTQHYFRKSNLAEIIDFGQNEFDGNFTLRVTNYTASIKAGNEKFFFANEPMDKTAFRYYQKINKELGGEIRETPGTIKYFDFSGMDRNQEITHLWCVDINSAYLSVLKNEKVITPETFGWINTTSRKNAKTKISRLKAVGMFAKNPLEVIYTNKEITKFSHERNPFQWVFFTACQKTGEAMELCKKELGDDYLFYWVDGIFTRKNPEKIVKILKTLGFQSKIEYVTKLKKTDKNIVFEKEGKQKILFLPQTYSEEIREFDLSLKNTITL